jgi:tetratricopeptide (TPR) repeat protein
MGAMFFILALFHYSYTRLAAKNTRQRLLHLFLCGVFFLLALGCKENTITLIPTILLTELLLFERNDKFSQKIFYLTLITNLIFLVAAIYFIYRQGYLNSIILPYGNRPFSIAERLLTQPSILLFYLSLLLFPNPSRLSIDHSFPVSTSILAPWTTLLAIVCIIFLLTLGFYLRKKAPLVSFAILFYFINHLIESTLIPLEMVFEHRNYLPSMFLFPVLACGLSHTLLFTSTRLRLVHATLVTFIPILLIANGLGTYSRNLVWTSEESLWSDALKKAPENARSWAKLGIIYGWDKEKSSENLRKSVALLQKATELNFPNVKFKAAFLDNIGKVYARYGLYEDSIQYFEKSLQINDKFIMARIGLVDSLQKIGNFESALNEINTILSTENINERFHLIKSTILLSLNKPVEALDSSRNYILKSNSNKKLGYYLLGTSLTKAGYHERGRWFLQLAKKDRPTDSRIILSLLENSALTDRQDDAKKLAQELLLTHNLPEITKMLQILENDDHSIPINRGIITPFIIESAQKYLLNISDHQ